MSTACELCGELAPTTVPWCCEGAAMAVRRHMERTNADLRTDLEVAKAMLCDAYARVAELERERL